jgi:hypothetical protein
LELREKTQIPLPVPKGSNLSLHVAVFLIAEKDVHGLSQENNQN